MTSSSGRLSADLLPVTPEAMGLDSLTPFLFAEKLLQLLFLYFAHRAPFSRSSQYRCFLFAGVGYRVEHDSDLNHGLDKVEDFFLQVSTLKHAQAIRAQNTESMGEPFGLPTRIWILVLIGLFEARR